MKQRITIIIMTIVVLFVFTGCGKALETSEKSDIRTQSAEMEKRYNELCSLNESLEVQLDSLISEAESKFSSAEDNYESQIDKLVRSLEKCSTERDRLMNEMSDRGIKIEQLKEIMQKLTDECSRLENEGGQHWFWMDYPYKKVLSLGNINIYNMPDASSRILDWSGENACLEVVCCVYPGAGIIWPETTEDCWLLVKFPYDEVPFSSIGWVQVSEVEEYNAETQLHLKCYVGIKEDADLWLIDYNTGEYMPYSREKCEKYGLYDRFYVLDKEDGEFAYIYSLGPTEIKCHKSDLIYPDF